MATSTSTTSQSETGTPATRTYRPTPFAVMPGSAVRGGILGLFYMWTGALLYTIALEVFEGTEVGSVLEAFLADVGWEGIVVLGLIIPVTLTLFLAGLGYKRRVYEVGPEGVSEKRGILLRSERLLEYDDFQGVSVTKSRLQSMYNAGTVRLTDVNQDEDEQVTMKLSYIQNPEDVSTNILRNLTDVTGATDGELVTEDVDEFRVASASVSRLSGDRLAASTGFRYLMPSGILQPRPKQAATYGALLGFGYALVGAALLIYFQDFVMGLADLPATAFYYGAIGIAIVGLTVLMSGWFYWKHDRMQYELYEDHITVIEGDKTTSFSLDDITDIQVHNRGLAALRAGGFGVLPWNSVGHISLRDEDGDELIEFRYISNSQAVYDALEKWLVDHSGPDTTPDSDSERDPGQEQTADDSTEEAATQQGVHRQVE